MVGKKKLKNKIKALEISFHLRPAAALLVEIQRWFESAEVKNAFPINGKNVDIKFPVDKSASHFFAF